MRVLAVLEKEFLEFVKNRMLLYGTLPLPLIFVAIPLAFVHFAGDQPVKAEEAEMYYRLSPALAGMEASAVLQIMVVGQMMMLLLILPVIIPMTIAAYSIIGEKQARTLEPLLATPIRTWELLLGKSLAATLPAVALTWIAYAILVVGMAIIAKPVVFAAVVSGMWILAILIIAPLLAILAVNLGVLISSKVNDTRVAQQIGGLLVLPFVGLGIAQTAGRVLYDLPMFMVGATVVAAADVAILAVATKLFQRETILTRWR